MDVVPQLETCRICAKCYLSSRTGEFLHLFEEKEGKECELDFIRKEIDCWQLEISPNDGLPQQICSNCFQKFCTIAAFRQDCLDAQDLLHKARQITETQAQRDASQEKTSTAILLPATIVLTNTQPITHQLSNTTSLTIKRSNLRPQVIEANNILSNENVLFNVVSEEAVIVNDAATSTRKQYESNDNAQQYEQISDDVVAQEADTTTQSSTEDFPKQSNNLTNDFEEVLEGSIIPKNLKKLLIETDIPLENLCAEDPLEENIPQRIASYPHACNYCYCPPHGPIDHLIFATSEELSQHFFDVHDPKLPYPCPKCPKLFASMANRNKHFYALHGAGAAANKAIKYCAFCNKKIPISQEHHEKSCNFIADWHCETCKNDFSQMPLHSFRAHQRSHAECHYRCDICNLMFSQLSLLLIHKRSHQKPNAPVNKDEFKCMACNQVFSSMYDLKCHEFARHNGKAAFRCKYCSKGYSTLAFLRRHMENAHTNRTSRLFGQAETNCPKCNATFQSKNKLHYHMQRTKFENGQCIPIRMASNMRLKAFACDQCMKYFNSKEQFEIHLETHTNAQRRLFACKKCNMRCRTNSELKEHDRMVHSKSKAFECEICGEKFAYNKELQTHQLYHAKLEFPCRFKDCKTSFKDEQALAAHMCVHESVSCEYCGKMFAANEIEVHIKTTHHNNNNEAKISNLKNVFTQPITDFSLNQNHVFGNFADPMSLLQQSSTLTLNQNANNCAPFVGAMDTNLLDEGGIIFGEEHDTIANNVDFIMSDDNLVNDSFISSLLDADYEIDAN